MVPTGKLLALGASSALLFTAFLSIPADAADRANSSGQAVELQIGGQSIVTAPRTSALDDENTVTYSGSESPIPNVTPGLLSLGVLTQTADTYIGLNGGQGSESSSEVASAGLDLATIDGSNLVSVPPVNTILRNALDSLQLGGYSISELESLLGLPPGTLSLLPGIGSIDDLIDQIENALNGSASAITDALTEALDSLDTNVELELNAVKSNADAFCLEDEVTLSGNGTVDAGRVVATVGGNELVLLTLPSASGPNTTFTGNLTALTNALRTEALDDVVSDLDTILQGALAGPYEDLITQIRDSILTQLDAALEPLFEAINDSVITGTINKQVLTENSIDVTALNLEVLPGAADFGVSGVNLNLANSKASVTDCSVTPVDVPEDDTPEDEPKDTPNGDNPPSTTPDRPNNTPRDPRLPDYVKSGL